MHYSFGFDHIDLTGLIQLYLTMYIPHTTSVLALSPTKSNMQFKRNKNRAIQAPIVENQAHKHLTWLNTVHNTQTLTQESCINSKTSHASDFTAYRPQIHTCIHCSTELHTTGLKIYMQALKLQESTLKSFPSKIQSRKTKNLKLGARRNFVGTPPELRYQTFLLDFWAESTSPPSN